MPKNVFITMLFICMFLVRNAEAKMMDERIYLVPAGNADKKVVEVIKNMLPGNLPMIARIEVLPQEKILESAYDPSRKQYSAEMVLNDISKRVPLEITRESALVISDVDLYSPESNFVLGTSNSSKIIGIISLTRLRNEFYNNKLDNDVFLKRVLKEAMYELGHAWGLPSCPNQKCVMCLSKDLSDIDKKRSWFCYECQNKLRKRYLSPLINGASLTLIK